MEDCKSSDLSDINAEIYPGRCEGSIPSDVEKPKTKKRKRGRNEDDELIEVLKKKLPRKQILLKKQKMRIGTSSSRFYRKLEKLLMKGNKLRSDIILVIATAQRPDYQQWPSHGGSLAPYLFLQPTQNTPSSSYPSSIIHQSVLSQQDPLHRFSRQQNMPNPHQNSTSPSSALSTNSLHSWKVNVLFE
ncbi:hypothetical protein AVEN_34386-1 [Araneus ventricosus]|uniref:Uncharacterized protein n=1 Tax=Araneus ventricosus TaxID=182803 RepID=A0A4Y2G3U7_ARAVE|nr:hypothetical protein AVEN_34386-1 [Araneus ventricosus]